MTRITRLKRGDVPGPHRSTTSHASEDLLTFNAVLTVCRRAHKSKLALRLMEAMLGLQRQRFGAVDM